MLYVDPNSADGDVAELAPLRAAIVSIALSGNPNVHGDLAVFAGMPGLQQLYVDGTGVGGSLEVLEGLTELTMLYVQDTDISGSVEALRGLTQLDTLDVSNTGVSGSVEALEGLTKLVRLFVDPSGVYGDPAKVKAALPGLLDFRYESCIADPDEPWNLDYTCGCGALAPGAGIGAISFASVPASDAACCTCAALDHGTCPVADHALQPCTCDDGWAGERCHVCTSAGCPVPEEQGPALVAFDPAVFGGLPSTGPCGATNCGLVASGEVAASPPDAACAWNNAGVKQCKGGVITILILTSAGVDGDVGELAPLRAAKRIRLDSNPNVRGDLVVFAGMPSLSTLDISGSGVHGDVAKVKAGLPGLSDFRYDSCSDFTCDCGGPAPGAGLGASGAACCTCAAVDGGTCPVADHALEPPCTCDAGWAGERCDVCKPAYSGDLCDFVPCFGVDCHGHGECEEPERPATADDTPAACACSPAYSGDLCNTFIPCFSVDCHDHGECEEPARPATADDSVDFTTCTCIGNWAGDRCENELCATINCGENGGCIRGECACAPGWAGMHCESDWCLPHGKRAPGSDGCACEPGYSGQLCTIDDCATINCGEHGRCASGACVCTNGFRGGRCEIDPCLPHGTFGEQTGCVCEPAYSSERCDVFAPCFGVDCGSHGTTCDAQARPASPRDAAAVCACNKGWEGESCEVDQCKTIDCGPNGTCKRGVCDCLAGVFGPRCDLSTPPEAPPPPPPVETTPPPPPTTCATVDDFAALVAAITAECCDEPSEMCEDGYPTTCNRGCAAVLLPARTSCEEGFLAGGGPFKAILDALDQAAAACSPPPPPCAGFEALQTYSLSAEAACCPGGACPGDDLPTTCSPGACADELETMQATCRDFLLSMGSLLKPIKKKLDAAVDLCDDEGGH
jgi:hypothetical protein